MDNYKSLYSAKTDIVLLAMPGVSVARPSLGLSLLKASIANLPYKSDILYANIYFEKYLGEYHDIFNFGIFQNKLFQEWVFNKLLFNKNEIDCTKYIDELSDYLLKVRKLPRAEENLIVCNEIFYEMQNLGESFIDSLASLIVQKSPKVVGCSSVFYQHISSLAILKKIKELDSEIITIIGGSNVSDEMGIATLNEFDFVDFIFAGEADETFPLFIKEVFSIKDKKKWKLPTGVLSQKTITPFLNPKANKKTIPFAQVVDMDKLPMPDFSDYFRDRSNYSQTPYFKNNPNVVIQIEASRGCWWFEKVGCTFCGLNPGKKTYRYKDIKKLAFEMDTLAKLYHPTLYMFTDNILNMDTFDEFVKFMVENKPDYKIFFETKSNLNRDKVKQLADAKILYVQAGIESLHDGVLKLMKKGTTAIKSIQFLKYVQEYGINVSWNLLMNFPNEKAHWYDEMASWFHLVSHLQPANIHISVIFQRFSHYYYNAESYNLNLVPQKYYKYIYPFNEERISKLCYNFEDEKYIAIEKSGVFKKVIEAFNIWRNEYYNKKGKPILQMEIKRNQVFITDTRSCAVSKQYVLKNNEAKIYLNCDPAVTKENLYNKLEGEIIKTVIDKTIDNLITKKLLLNLSGKYLSLAIIKPQ